MKTVSVLALLTLAGCQSAPVKQMAVCQNELQTAQIERDIVMLEAQNIVEKVQAIQQQHEADKARALKFLRDLSLYCPKKGA